MRVLYILICTDMFSIIVKSVIELLTDGCDLLLYNPLNLEPLQELLADKKVSQNIDIRLLIETVDHQF